MLALWGPHSLHSKEDWGTSNDCGLSSVKQVDEERRLPIATYRRLVGQVVKGALFVCNRLG